MNFKKITLSNSTVKKALTPRKSYSKNEREQLIRLWQNSNQTQTEFCAEHDINIKNFYRWRTQFSTDSDGITALEHPTKPAVTNPTKTAASLNSNSSLHCRLPNGVELKFDAIFDPNVFTALIKGIAQCTFN